MSHAQGLLGSTVSLLLQSPELLSSLLAATALISLSLAGRLEPLQPLLRIASLMLVFSSSITSFGNWLPQAEGGFPTVEPRSDIWSLSSQQLADRGETIIFGGIGQSRVQGAIGKGQCPLCHTFWPRDPDERAPNLWGISARQRLKDTSIEYIAESHVCPSCYVVGGYGVRGTENRESPMPAIHRPPISLSIEELVAVDTWLFMHEGEVAPSPDKIRMVYEALIPVQERPETVEDKPRSASWQMGLLADGSERVDIIFAKAQCVLCHTIPGIPGATGTIGPRLEMKTQGPWRMRDTAYRGRAKTVRDYVGEAILYPGLYVPKGYRDGMMPKIYGTMLSGLAVDKMVSYLSEVEAGKAPPPIQ